MKRNRALNLEETPVEKLHRAIKNTFLDQCRSVITDEEGKDIDLDARNKYNESALDIAVWNGDAAISRLLINAGASLTATNENNETSFRLAAEYLFTHMKERKSPTHLEPSGIDFERIVEESPVKKRRTELKPETPEDTRSPDERHQQDSPDDAEMKYDEGKVDFDPKGSGAIHAHNKDYDAYLETFRVLLVSGADPNTFWDLESHQTLLSKAAEEGYLEPCKLLLLAGADPNISDGLRNTALHTAVQFDNEDICRLLLISETAIDAKNQVGRTALHVAAHKNCVNVCKMLALNEADPYAEDESRETPLLIAVTRGHEEFARVLLHSFQIDFAHKYENFHDRTLLHLASNEGHTGICKLIVEEFDGQCYVNAADKEQMTPLHLAVIRNHQDTCNFLLSKNASIELGDKNKLTPLHHAARENNKVLLETLLARARETGCGNLVNATTDDGNTALHFAMKKAKYDVVNPLVQHKADPWIKNQDGMSPFLVAVIHAKPFDLSIVFNMILLERPDEIAKLKLDKDTKGITALHIAAKKDKREVVKSLVNNYQMDCSVRNEMDYVPLHFAAKLKRPGICQFLVEKAPELVNARGKDDVTPLHMAAFHGSEVVCKFLLKHGSLVNAEDQVGETPLHYASRRGDDKICSLLIKHGADALAANKLNGEIPVEVWPDDIPNAAKTLQRERRSQSKKALMQTGERQIDIVKLFLVGHPEAGKTTLKNAMDQEEYGDMEKRSYTPTPGISIERKPVGMAGNFSVWDCAGQMEYHVTHGMFLGAENGIFFIVYDLVIGYEDSSKKRAHPRQIDEIYYWLAFIKAVSKNLDETKPKVALVATHFDLIPEEVQDTYKSRAKDNIQQAQGHFKQYLDIADDLLILGLSCDMTDFHKKVEGMADTLRKTRKIKGLCYKIERNKDSWITAGQPPIIPFSTYINHVTEFGNPPQRLIRAATIDLHDMGMIYRAHLRKQRVDGDGLDEGIDDFIVLDPNWLFSTVVGRLFAGTNMPKSQLGTDNYLYTSSEICQLLETEIDMKLLMTFMIHLDLAVKSKTGEDQYLIPAKLPATMDQSAWSETSTAHCDEVYGRRIQCRNDIIDKFTPTTFPCLQTRILKSHEHVIVVQNRLKFTSDGLSVLVQMTEDKRGIDVIVRGRGVEERGVCYSRLQEALGIIRKELEEHSPGTSTTELYLSSHFLQRHSPLSPNYVQIRTFTAEELLDAEKHHSGKVYHNPKLLEENDNVKDLICFGYDPFFIRHLGLECPSKWTLFSALKAMDDCLSSDEAIAEGSCHKFLAGALGIRDLKNLEKNEWILSADNGRSLGHLRAITAHPGLVGNHEAVGVLDDMLGDLGIKKPEDEQCPLPSDIQIPPPDVSASRAVVRQFWSKIRENTNTETLLGFLDDALTSPEKEELQHSIRKDGPMKAASKIAPMLLSKSECSWFGKLLQGLENANIQRYVDIGREIKRHYDNHCKLYRV